MKAISPLLRLQYFLRRFRLLTISKSFIRPYLDYGDVIYQISNASFSSKLESVKYYAALAITGVSRGSFREKPLPGTRTRASASHALDETFMLVLQSPLK